MACQITNKKTAKILASKVLPMLRKIEAAVQRKIVTVWKIEAAVQRKIVTVRKIEAAVLRKTKIQVAARNNQVAAQKNEVAARRKIEDPSSCPEKKLKIQVAARKNEVAVRNHLFYDTHDKY